MEERKKNRAAVALANLRAKSLTAEERSEIARKAGKASRAALTPEERSAIARKAGLAGGRGRKKQEEKQAG
jgi:general stress protein YciG